MMIKVQIQGDDQPTLVTPEVYQAAIFGKVSHSNLGVVYSEGEAPVYAPADISTFDTSQSVPEEFFDRVAGKPKKKSTATIPEN